MKKELNLGNIIEGLCIKMELSNQEIANVLGVTKRTIENYKDGRKPSSKIDNNIFDKILNIIELNHLDIFNLFNLDGEEYLFHASKKGIKGQITTKVNEDKSNDFGNGFYLSENLKTAITYVCGQTEPKIYRFKKKDIFNGKCYRFSQNIDDVKKWVLFIGLNRGKVKEENNKVLFKEYFDKCFSKYSIIEGKIADSFNFDVLEAFFDNEYDIKQVDQALKQVDIGNQIVIKDEKIANSLEDYDEFTIEKNLKKYFMQWHRNKVNLLREFNKQGIDKENANKDLSFRAIREEFKEIVGKENGDKKID